METIRNTVPGVGTIHHFTTRGGQQFGVLVEGDKTSIVAYGAADPDVPAQIIALEQDESDLLAQILHSRPITDRLADLERRVAAVVGE